MTRWFPLALLMSACLASSSDPQESPNAAEPPLCSVVFTPAGDIAELVESAALQWSEATGCDVHLGEGGVPVRFVDRILDAHGNPQCAATYRLRDDAGVILGADRIEVSTNRGDRCHLAARDVLHEMGHALAPHRAHTTEGLMAPVPNGVDYVDEVSRAYICGELACY